MYYLPLLPAPPPRLIPPPPRPEGLLTDVLPEDILPEEVLPEEDPEVGLVVLYVPRLLVLDGRGSITGRADGLLVLPASVRLSAALPVS